MQMGPREATQGELQGELHAKGQGQRLDGSKIDWKQTDGQTDGRRRLHYLPR